MISLGDFCELKEDQYHSLTLKYLRQISFCELKDGLSYGSVEVVRMLLENEQIEISAQNKVGWTALMLAAYSGHEEVINYLLERMRILLSIQAVGMLWTLPKIKAMKMLFIVYKNINKERILIEIKLNT